MDKVRKGEIALMMLEEQLRGEGIRLTPKFKREMGNKAKAIGIPIEEFMEFIEELVRAQVDEVFKKSESN